MGLKNRVQLLARLAENSAGAISIAAREASSALKIVARGLGEVASTVGIGALTTFEVLKGAVQVTGNVAFRLTSATKRFIQRINTNLKGNHPPLLIEDLKKVTLNSANSHAVQEVCETPNWGQAHLETPPQTKGQDLPDSTLHSEQDQLTDPQSLITSHQEILKNNALEKLIEKSEKKPSEIKNLLEDLEKSTMFFQKTLEENSVSTTTQ